MNRGDTVHLHGGALGPDVNLGDALMLHEVIRRLRGRFGPDVRLSLRPEAGPYDARAALRLLQYLRPTTRLRPRGLVGYPILRRYGPAFGIVADTDLAACVNFMGYRYFDVGRRETRMDLRLVSALHDRGAPTILLPQAFGPFSSPALRADARRLFDRSALVFARDPQSAGEVAALRCRRPEVLPDLTIATPPGDNPRPDLAGAVCVIPNLWMTRRTAPAEARAYVACLVGNIARVRAAGLPCYVLAHSPLQDLPLAREIAAACATPPEVLAEPDPLRAKALVGSARFVVGSRYHGLLAALSQDVPVLATSWAHKYAGLLADYGCPEMLVAPSRPDEVAARLEVLLDAPARDRLAAALPAANATARARLEAMWTRVLDLLAAALNQRG